MKIIHKLDDFTFTIFPDLKGVDKKEIIKYLIDFYTEGIHKPKVVIENDIVIIDIDDIAIEEENNDYRKTVALCEQGKYNDAKPILHRLIEKNPTNSEYYRIMGQMLSDEGKQDEAINYLINALRWDSKNGWALLMMGNIFAKFKDDIKTAMKYYDQALIANPIDHITINNIGANLMQQGKFEEAKKYFWKAIKINDKYPNTHYALGMIAKMENDLQSAFYSTLMSLKLNKNKDVLYNNSINQLFELAKDIVTTNVGKTINKEYLVKLEVECGTDIEIIEDDNIATNAKFEFAENHNKSKHIIRYKSNQAAFEHLIMHELTHLDFAIQARKEEINQVYITTDSHKILFNKKIEPTVKRLKKQGIPEDSIESYCSGLFEGINGQVYNTPIDLFIEDFLFTEFSDLRPFQFLSLFSIINDGLQAVTEKSVVRISPPDILSKSKIYNLVSAMQFRELYGVDLISNFKATQSEIKQAESFYKEYLEYKDDKKPAEEYELVQHWAEDLSLDKYFELQGEIQYRKSQNLDSFFESMQNDPLGIDERDPVKERQMKDFQESQKKLGTNMAVIWFMVDALQYFDGMSQEKIKKIAFEIAMQGTQGYSPDKKDYTLNLIPEKKFSGYHILAYYYVSWALSAPEMLHELQLPYDNEYKQALIFFKSKQK